ncbi:MAG: 16S rRNA (guanine(966)-N(2))-methyltransferase RsmD [bacterium]|nr:16S rRNA (guanine(966)-N(2))-methyltransferase RsmD [bacterium]
MRVITGFARGKKLATLSDKSIRPTSDKVKEALFSAIQFDIEGRRVLDLFAGSGQLGIEALSRGCDSAVFIDNSQDAINIIKQNLKNTGLQSNSVVFKSDYSDFLLNCKDNFDIAFLDPPYASGVLNDALEKTSNVMSSYGIIICEHPTEFEICNQVNNFHLAKQYRYGKIFISLYKRL